MGALAVAAIAFVACNKVEQSVETPEKTGIPFEFIAAGIDTKTTNDGNHTNWLSGDNVNLFHAEAGSTTYVSDGKFTAGEDGESVTFSGTLAEALTADEYDWYAIYPYSSYITTPASTSSGYVTIGSSSNGSQAQAGNNSMSHLAGTRYPVAGKVSNVAKETKPSISMSQLSSVIAVCVTNETTAPITVSAVSFTGTENIVGQFYVDFTSSPVGYTDNTGYVSATASLNVTSGSAIDSGESATFYMAVKPFTAPASGIISLSVTADNGEQVRDKELGSTVSFVAGTINTLRFTYDKAASSLPEPSEVTGWYRVEKPAWLTAGDRVIIANNDGTKAMSKAYKANNRDGVDVTTAASGDYTVLTNNDNVQLFILEDGTASGSFAFWADNGDDASKYMYAASSEKNYLKFQTDLDANASFVATLVDGLGNLTAQGTNTRKVVQWNNLFGCYSAASYNDISIYKYYGVWPGSTTCADPTIAQEGSTITISSTTPGVTIYYTTNGTDPDPADATQKYTHAFSISSAVTVKAIAVRSHYSNSGISSFVCTPQVATPEISSSANAFTITCTTPGVTIYYETSTVDLASVATPTTSSSTYSSAVAYSATTYVKAIAVKDGYVDSEVATATCTYTSGGTKIVTLQYTGSSTTNMTEGNNAATLGLDAEKWSVVADKGNNSNYPGLNKAHDIRLYWAKEGSNSITVTALETGVTITSITITYTGDTYKNGVVMVGGNPVDLSDGAYPINSTSFVVTNGNATNVQVRFSKIEISYTTSD